MKNCIECKILKPLGEFYAHPQMADGCLGICKECHRRRMTQRRRSNPSVQEYDRNRAKTTERKKHAAATSKRWVVENPVAYKTLTAFSNAVRDGKIKRRNRCEKCGSTKNIRAVHRDYKKRFDVIWLCALCHHRTRVDFPQVLGRNKTSSAIPF